MSEQQQRSSPGTEPAQQIAIRQITKNNFIRLGILAFKEHELREIVAAFCKLPGIAPRPVDAAQPQQASPQEVQEACALVADRAAAKLEEKARDLFKQRGEFEVRAARDTAYDIAESIRALIPPAAVPSSPAGEAAYRETARRIAAIREKRLAELRDCLQSIADMPTNEPREPDDADWRFRCLSAVEAAKNTLTIPSTNRYCPNGLEHGNCLFPECVSSCPGRLSLAPAHRGDGAQ